MITYEDFEEINPDLTFIGEEPTMYKDAIVGLSSDNNHVIYSYDRLRTSMMIVNKWSYEEADEWISYNVLRSLPYMQPYEPIVMMEIDD